MMWERIQRWWASLSGTQQFLIGAGVPTAAVAAVVGNLRDRQAAPETEGEGEGEEGVSGPRQPINPSTDNIDLIIAFNRIRQSLVDAFEEALDRMPAPEPEPDPEPPLPPDIEEKPLPPDARPPPKKPPPKKKPPPGGSKPPNGSSRPPGKRRPPPNIDSVDPAARPGLSEVQPGVKLT